MTRLTLLLLTLLCSFNIFSQYSGYPEDLKDRPAVIWKADLNAPLFGSPVTDGKKVYAGSLDNSFYAIDINKGETVWKFATRGEIRSTATIEGNSIYFLSGDGYLYCLNKETGKEVWTFQTGGEKKYGLFSYADYYHSSPLIVDDMIYFGSGDSCIYAVSRTKGQLHWKYKTGDVVHGSPSCSDSSLFIGSFDGNVYCLDLFTGSLKWKFKTVGHRYFPKGEVQGNSTYFDHTVFVGARDYNLYALNTEKGYCYWNRKFDQGWAMGTPSIKDSIVYMGTSDDKLMLSINPYSGQINWKTNTKFNIFGGVAFSDSLLYAGTLMGKLLALDQRTGAIQWVYETQGYLSNKANYFNSDDSYRKDIPNILRSGDDWLQMYYSLGAIFSRPLIIGKKLLFSSTDGHIYCLSSP